MINIKRCIALIIISIIIVAIGVAVQLPNINKEANTGTVDYSNARFVFSEKQNYVEGCENVKKTYQVIDRQTGYQYVFFYIDESPYVKSGWAAVTLVDENGNMAKIPD